MLAPLFGNINPSVGGYNEEGAGLGHFIRNLVTSAFLVSGLATFAYLVMGGFKYITAGGDVKATESAMKMITGAIFGLIIVLGSYGIAKILESVFGIRIFTPSFTGPTP